MNEELLRRLLFRVLAGRDRAELSIVYREIQRMAADEDLFPQSPEEAAAAGRSYECYERGEWDPQDEEMVRVLIWECIIQGVLVPGQSLAQPNLPWMRVTQYGQSIVSSSQATPYEPDPYLRSALESAIRMDEKIGIYLTESVKSFRRNLYLSSAVMLGVASEAAFLALSTVVSDRVANKLARKISRANSMKAHHDLVMQWVLTSGVLEGHPDLRERVETYLGTVFGTYRLTRNDAGHPSGRSIPRDVAYSHLSMFPSYLETLSDLIDFLQENSQSD